MFIVIWEDRDNNSYHDTFIKREDAVTQVKMLKASGFINVYFGVAVEQ
jgi:hypothetical protein